MAVPALPAAQDVENDHRADGGAGGRVELARRAPCGCGHKNL